MRYLLTISYIGTAYHGWQVQENALAVQPVVQDALQKLLGLRPALSGCSRTDSGVHARMYCCHFDFEKALDGSKVVGGLNHFLPADIGALDCCLVADDFHARYSCRGKEYRYLIQNSWAKDPFLEGRALRYPHPIDERRLDSAAKAFVGRHDFSAFCSAGAKQGDKTRTVTLAEVTRSGQVVQFRVAADGFLYNMVRIMAGTLLRVAEGRIDPDEIPSILASADRTQAGPTAPACGLYLSKVYY